MNAEKPLNLWVKIAAIVGGFGSFIAIGFLIWNLIEIRRQQEFEYRGFLAIKINQVEFLPNSHRFDYKYQYYQASKVPVLLRGNEWRMLSSSREIDVVAWLKDMNSDLKQAKDQGMIVDRVEPVIYDDEQERMFGYNDVLAKLDSAFYVTSNKIGLEQSVFLHYVFHYEDLMGENYWV